MNALKSLYFLPLLGLAAVALGGCGRGEASEKTVAETPREIPVAVAPATVADALARHSGTTWLQADEESAVAARTGGQVLSILAEEGQRVEAGQVLAELDAERLRLQMEKAGAELEKLRSTYRRNVALHERGLVAEGAFETLRFDLEALESAYQLARLQYSYTRIRAPIDGVISAREVKIGTTVKEGETLFRITNMDNLVAYVHVPQRELHRFEAGQEARLAMAAWPGESFGATITRISPTVDAGSGTFRITLAVPAGDGRLRPGMFGKLDIVYEVHEDALLIPSEAILAEDMDQAVYVVADGVARRRSVTTGLDSDGRIEVLSGLTPGENVVVVGQNGLKDGSPVLVRGPAQEI